MFFSPCAATAIAAAIKKGCNYRSNCGIRFHDGDLEHSLMKEKKNRSLDLCHSRFRFRNLKDTNLCMSSWWITNSGLLICSWHDVTLSQFA